MASEEFILKGLTILASVFPHSKVTEQTLQIYAGDLADLPEQILELAFAECRTTCEFFPTLKAIRDTAARLALGDSLEALEAWSLVKQFARNGDYNHVHEFDDPLITECARILGWRDYLNSPTNDEPSWRARFCEIYNQLRERQVRGLRSLPQVNEYRRLSSGSLSIDKGVASLIKRLAGH